MAIKAYSLAKDGNKKLSANFAVKEFRCKDGTDPIFIDDVLVKLLQNIRNHFGKAVTITSAYRTAAHNKAVKGAKFFRAVFFFPYVASLVAICVCWNFLLMKTGPVNQILSLRAVKALAGKFRLDDSAVIEK